MQYIFQMIPWILSGLALTVSAYIAIDSYPTYSIIGYINNARKRIVATVMILAILSMWYAVVVA